MTRRDVSYRVNVLRGGAELARLEWESGDAPNVYADRDSEIKMSDDVSYSYSLDTFNKTISFSFGKYTGSGSYAFSPERDTLVITEENPDSEQGKASTKLVKQ